MMKTLFKQSFSLLKISSNTQTKYKHSFNSFKSLINFTNIKTFSTQNTKQNSNTSIVPVFSSSHDSETTKSFYDNLGNDFWEEFDKASRPKTDTFIYRSPLHALKELKEIITENNPNNHDNLNIELNLIFNIDPIRPDNNYNFIIKLPHQQALDIKILAFTLPEQEEKALSLGADYVINETIYKEIEEGKFRFNKVIATKDAIDNIRKLKRLLTPENLFPCEKVGTCTDIEKFGNIIKELKEGATQYGFGKKTNSLSIDIGRLNSNFDEVLTNVEAVLSQIWAVKPTSSIGKFLLRASFKVEEYEKKMDIMNLNPERKHTYFFNKSNDGKRSKNSKADKLR